MRNYIILLLLLLGLGSCRSKNEPEVALRHGVVFRLCPTALRSESMPMAPARAQQAITSEPTVLLVVDECAGVSRDTVIQWADLQNGQLLLPLANGGHTLRFVLAVNGWADFDRQAKTLAWDLANCYDTSVPLNYTWGANVQVNIQDDVVEQEVSLPLIVGRVDVQSSDIVPVDCAAFGLEGKAVCWTLDLITMMGCSPQLIGRRWSSTGYVGKTIYVAVYSFAPVSGNIGRVRLRSYRADNSVLTSRGIYDPVAQPDRLVPITAGRITSYSGEVFAGGEGLTVSPVMDWTGTDRFGL